MATQDYKRKLTAILSADVKGYSQLMGEDEEATVRTITAYRQVITEVVQKHRGRVVDSPGDNVLAEFASVVDAMRGAVEIQEELKVRNAELPENRRMEFRIGVNLGDVIHEEERIYGDGVNVAARVENLADPGGICISRSAYDQVKNKLTLGYENLGEYSVKNISEPVRIYKVLMDPESAGKVIGERRVEPKSGQRITISAVIVLLLVVGGAVLWKSYQPTVSPPVEVASEKKMAFPLPEKPSLAILPFDNLSGDSSQDYLSDGFTETIITELSNLSNLFVIARNSTFTYKGKPVKVQRVAEELGVRYVLEGSVQRSGDRVRITAQLIDALTGHHLWAENYDREFGDIFALQDDITEHVAMALQVKLTEGEQALIRRGHEYNPEAYEYYLRGLESYRSFTKENNDQARKLYEKVVALDPNYALGWCSIGWTHYRDGRFGWTNTPAQSLALAEELGQKALALDNSMSEAYSLLSVVSMARRQHDKAVAYAENTIALAPNFASNLATVALPFLYSGKPEVAVELVQNAMRHSPYYPSWYLPVLGLAYRLTGQYDEAIDALESWRARANPRSSLPYLCLAYTYVEAGRGEEAQVAVAEVLKRNTKASIEHYAKSNLFPYKDPAEIERVLDSLRKAGLPEKPPLPLPDKPSIAVLAFDNLSGDPEQEYFSDGIAEEIITALSKISHLFVIARNSSFTYKGKPVKVQEVGKELGVRYVLEGSVRKSGDRVRITAQLVDTKTGRHLWAERYDRKLKDIFAVQDEITKEIITALQVKLTQGEKIRVLSRSTDNLNAYQKYLKGRVHFLRFNSDDNAVARQLWEEAIALDPEFTSAYVDLAWTYLMDIHFGVSKSTKESLGRADQLAQRAISLDETSPFAHSLASFIFAVKRQFEEAIAEGEKAVALSPNDSLSRAMLGRTLAYAGRYEEALAWLEKAIRLDPIPLNWYLTMVGHCYLYMGRHEEALEEFKKVLHRNPNDLTARIRLVAAYSLLGRKEDASAEAAELLRRNPKVSIENIAKWPYKNKADLDLIMNALRKAGLS